LWRDRDAYTRAKTAFVEHILRLAEGAGYGHPRDHQPGHGRREILARCRIGPPPFVEEVGVSAGAAPAKEET